MGWLATATPPTMAESSSFNTGWGLNVSPEMGGASTGTNLVWGSPVGFEAGFATPGWGIGVSYSVEPIELLSRLFDTLSDVAVGLGPPGPACGQ
jgi:hypothetical protein